MLKKFFIFFIIVIFTLISTEAKNLLSGNVTDNSNNPLAGVRIVLGSYSQDKSYSSPLVTYTNKKGEFRFNDIIPGVQSIEAEKISYRVFGDTISINNGNNVYNITLRKKRNSSGNSDFENVTREKGDRKYSGRLIDSVSNEPVKNAYVVFGNQITRSDNEGLFSIQLNSF
ncbi:MAG: carboxypeptidase-like regulatory domain-containing protein, partial [Candidatus Muiribacteriota bacterium]